MVTQSTSSGTEARRKQVGEEETYLSMTTAGVWLAILEESLRSTHSLCWKDCATAASKIQDGLRESCSQVAKCAYNGFEMTTKWAGRRSRQAHEWQYPTMTHVIVDISIFDSSRLKSWIYILSEDALFNMGEGFEPYV
jgi:hypothetical protein